ncbi:MAG: leucine-rich repeat domain-containing protein [Bacteroidales bacterium]|nr:leucine-rich repeat domain-containing protein [Bacteroidales bacterium]
MSERVFHGIVYLCRGGDATVTGMRPTASPDVVILSSVDGFSVTTIEKEAFRGSKSLKSVRISEGLTRIGDYAFYGCTFLSSVTLPGSLKHVGKHAFRGCPCLKEVIYAGTEKGWEKVRVGDFNAPLNSGVAFVPGAAPAKPADEKKETAGVVKFSGKIRQGSAARTPQKPTVYMGESVRKMQPPISGPVMMKQFNGYVVVGPGTCTEGEITVPSVYRETKVIEIANEAFKNCRGVTGVSVPPGVVRIGDEAFANCSSLVSVTIPRSVSKIGAGVFKYCGKLSEINYLGTKFDWDKTEKSFDDELMSKMKFLGTVQLSFADRARETPQENFGRDRSPKDGELGYARESDGYVVTGTGTFTGTDFVIPESREGLPVVGVAEGAFHENGKSFTRMRCVNFPKTLTRIGKNAFWGCTALEEVTVPDGVTVMEPNVFRRCKSLKKVSLGAGMTEIGSQAFAECTALESFDIPKSVVKIGDQAFARCDALKRAVLPKGIQRIEDYTFAACTSLTGMNVPESVFHIGKGAFYDCESLMVIVLPKSLSYLGPKVFKKCDNLRAVCFLGDEKMWHEVEIDDPDGDFDSSHVYFYADAETGNAGKRWCYNDAGKIVFV